MKLGCFFFCLFPFLGVTQNDSIRTLAAFGVNGGIEILQPSDLSYTDFQSSLNAPDFIFESALAHQITPERLYSRQSITGYVRLRIAKSKNLGSFKQFYVQLGALYSSGQNLSYELYESMHQIGDSVYVTENGETQSYTRDTIFNTRTTYNSYMKNIGMSTEFLMSAGNERAGFSIGLGSSFQMSLTNVVKAEQSTYYETALYNNQGEAVYYQPTSSTASNGGSGSLSVSNDFGHFSQEHQLNTNYLLTTYVPLKLEATLSDKPVWSQLSMEFTAKLGYEMLFSPSQSFSGRLAYGMGVGLNYYL